MIRFLVATIVLICLGFMPAACSSGDETADIAVVADATSLIDTTEAADAGEAVDAQHAQETEGVESADTTTANKEQ